MKTKINQTRLPKEKPKSYLRQQKFRQSQRNAVTLSNWRNDIINQWQQGKTVDEIADKLKLNPSVVANKIRAYNSDYLIEGW
jgi:DNA-binding NarL/FixJ family response regulator